MKISRVIAAATLAAALGLAAEMSAARAMPVASTIDKAAAPPLGLVERAQYYHRGHRYCWYPNGWNGGGWYWCGYHHRYGYGWGGAAGWNGWYYGTGPGPGRYYYHGRWYYR